MYLENGSMLESCLVIKAVSGVVKACAAWSLQQNTAGMKAEP